MAKLAVKIPQLVPRPLTKLLIEQKKASEEALKKADPKLPQTKHTGTYKELAKVAQYKLGIMESLAE